MTRLNTWREIGQLRYTSWKHIKLLYKLDDFGQEIRMLHKLTDGHVCEKNMPKMSVKVAGHSVLLLIEFDARLEGTISTYQFPNWVRRLYTDMVLVLHRIQGYDIN